MIPAHRRNVVLIGMMGCGKTTVGRQVARRLGRAFVDTDSIIRIETTLSIPEVFEQFGEAGFRRMERLVVRRVAAVPNQVIAVGGGAVCSDENVAALSATGDVILLHAPMSLLAARVATGMGRASRPLLSGTSVPGTSVTGNDDPLTPEEASLRLLEELWAQREARYTAAATHRVDAGHRPAPVIADEIVAWLRARHLAESGPGDGVGL